MKVTIALATYNVASYLRDSINRMIGQTLRDIEILCIDDASTDGTVEILREYAGKDSRIRLIEKTKNEGLAVSRNQALELAKGDFICFVDGDDLMDLDLMEQAYTLALHENADVVLWDYYEFGENLFKFIDKSIPSSLIGVSPTDRHRLIRRMAFTWVRLFKTESIRKLGIHFPEGRTKQDQPVHWLTTACLNKIAIIPERKYAYRISSTQTSSKRGRVLLDIAFVSDYTEQVLREHHVFEEYAWDFYHLQLGMLKGMYEAIQPHFQEEALIEIRKRYNEEKKLTLKSESKSLQLFYKGVVQKKLIYSVFYKLNLFIHSIYRIL